MAKGYDPRDRRATGEGEREREREGEAIRPQPELRWAQLREPKHAVEIGRNGRVLASHYHEGYDAWEMLLETYEGEVSERGR